MIENNIMLVNSGRSRTEVQQARDEIAILQAKIENLQNAGKHIKTQRAKIKLYTKK